MKKLILILTAGFCLLTSGVSALDIVTATIAVTNSAGTTNGQTIEVNTNVRTWTNSVYVPASQILTNDTAAGAATNLFFQVAAHPFTGLSLARTTSTNITLQTAPGGSLTVTLSPGWGLVTWSTQSLVSATVVRVPNSVESLAQRTNVATGLTDWLNLTANNSALDQNRKVAEQLMGLANTQTVAGVKVFTNTLNIFVGTVTGNVYGVASEATVASRVPVIMSANNTNQYLLTKIVDGDGTVYTGPLYNGSSNTIYAIALSTVNLSVELTNWINNVLLYNSRTNRTTVHSYAVGTNSFAEEGDISFSRHAVTSLANGNNAAVPVGTNVFVEVSGPTGAFTINGINAGGAQRDGKLLVVVNQTGQNMTIAHDSGTDPTAANRIYSLTGADRATTGNGAATLIYSGAASRWLLISFDP